LISSTRTIVATLLFTAVSYAQSSSTTGEQHAEGKRTSPLVKPAVLKSSPKPNCGAEVRKAGVHGKVVLSVVVNTQGAVDKIKVLQGLGETVDKCTLEAVSKWRYEPTTLNGQPMSTQTTVTLNYK
jgi:TonB family protein